MVLISGMRGKRRSMEVTRLKDEWTKEEGKYHQDKVILEE